jgi:hypothetical protein
MRGNEVQIEGRIEDKMRRNHLRMKNPVRWFFFSLVTRAIIIEGGDEGCSKISSSSVTGRSRYK